MDTKVLLKMNIVARMLNVTEARARDLGREGILPVVKLGRQVRVDPDALESFIKNGGKSLPGGWRKEGRSE